MRYLIDTSSISRAVWDDGDRVRRAVWELGIEQIVVSVMTIVEIEFGLARRKVRQAHVVREFVSQFGALAFDRPDARRAGYLRAEMEALGGQIGVMDTLIASQALVRDLTVITHNARDFGRVRELRVLEL